LSTAPLYPESKTENAIYVAFGTTLGLGFMRWYTPDIFSDVVSALAIALFLGSLVGSTLFYIKLERIVDWIVRRWIMKKYGREVCQFLVSSHLAIETWRMRVTGNWETVESKSKTMLLRVTEGPDVHNEMWSLRGAFYFVLAIPIIIYVAGIQLDFLILSSSVLFLVVMISVRNNHRDFMTRCSRIVMFRLIQELYSVFRARDPGKRPVQNWFIGNSSSKDNPPIELVLEELELLLEKHDWNGFIERFLYLEEEIAHWLSRSVQDLDKYYIEQWASILAESDFDKKLHLTSQIMYYRGILQSMMSYKLLEKSTYNPSKKLELLMKPNESDIPLDPTLFFSALDEIGVEEKHSESIRRAFPEIAKTSYNPKILEIILKWMKNEKIWEFESIIIKSCERLNDPHIESVIMALKTNGKNVQWHSIGPRLAKRLIRIKEKIPDNVFVQALRSQNGDTIMELLAIFDYRKRVIRDAFIQLAKHSVKLVRQRNRDLFLSENEDQVSDYLIRLMNTGSPLQQSAARLLLELCSAKETDEKGETGVYFSSYCEEIKNLLELSPKEVRLVMLNESLSSGINIPFDIIHEFFDKSEMSLEEKSLAWKLTNR